MSPRSSRAATPVFRWHFLHPKFWLEWLLLAGIGVLYIFPRGCRQKLADWFGFLHYRLDAKRRHYAAINLKFCFPELSSKARDKLARRHFQVRLQVLFDMLLFLFANRERLLARTELQGLEHLQTAQATGKSIIILTCHSSALDYGAVSLSFRYPVIAVYNPFKTALADWLIYRLRTRFGMSMSRRQDGFRKLVKSVRLGNLLYYASDEDLGRQHSLFVPFFGRPKATLPTLGRLAKLCDALVIPCYTWYEPGRQGYITRLLPALSEFPNSSVEQDAVRMNQTIEELIQIFPAQYMWTLRLFKTALPGHRSPYKKSIVK